MAEDEPTVELKIRILDEEYPFPAFNTLSYKEARRIKKETGLVMGQFYDALEDGDPDALMSVALTAKLRDDPGFNPDELSDLLLSDIEVIAPAVEADEVPLGETSSGSDAGSKPGSGSEPTSQDETPAES